MKGASRSGAVASANVPNAQRIPASLLAHHYSHHTNITHQGDGGAGGRGLRNGFAAPTVKASDVTAYTVNRKWDSHFVLAPDSAVQVQNTFVQLQRRGGGGGASWSRLRDDYIPRMQLPGGMGVGGPPEVNGTQRAETRPPHEWP